MISHIDSFYSSPKYKNYDWRKFAVNHLGKFCGYIFEHDGGFLTVHHNKYYSTKEKAAEFLIKRKGMKI